MMEMKTIKKALMQNSVRISDHTFKRIAKRGYTRSDMIACIMQGELTETQMYKGRLGYQIEGFDVDGQPMVMIIGHEKQPAKFKIVTCMPPISKRFKRVI